MKYPDDFLNKIICNDCLGTMREMPNNCIDTIITDPPYGLKFMGKKWDYDVPSIEIWQECLKVLKPGGTALIFAGSRTQHRMAVNIEDAGFILKDCIMWLYGSGFPKATDISKQIDKKAGKKRKVIGKYRRPDGSGERTEKPSGTSNFGVGGDQFLTAPATPEAILWNGWKSHGLKPAYEPILVCMKPNEGSYANNALKWGEAGINVDGGRISYENEEDRKEYTKKQKSFKNSESTKGYGNFKASNPATRIQTKGRYPANVILDEEAGRLLDEQSEERRSAGNYKNIEIAKQGGGIFGGGEVQNNYANDTGGASRFFYCAKASKAERNRGCEGLELKELKVSKIATDSFKCKVCGGWIRPNPNIDNRPNSRCFCKNPIPSETKTQNKKVYNPHPTVKPLALMKYLCTLTKTPTSGIVLDPFCGSGTTLMACKELKRDYIGIDNNAEYCEIAKRRVNATPEPLF
ncbi:site-specific DNA-methyltransferase [Candidatus Atribacteria bacterium 1244-E10-H5-B2]|nr:MAG: site-specific DNA-methyltransferase [Candidatus Atribacteria bacterium 1244-E10-H5-B2]